MREFSLHVGTPRLRGRHGTCAVCCLFALSAAQAFAEQTWGPNLVTNPSFEEGDRVPVYWSRWIGAMQDKVEENFSIVRTDKKVARTGEKSLTLYGDKSTTRWQAVASTRMPVEPGAVYQLSGWIRTTDVKQEEEQFLNCNLYLQFFDGENRVVNVAQSSILASRVLTGTNDWTEVARIVQAPQGAKVARVGCVLTTSGSAWFDDVAFQKRIDVAFAQKESDRFVFIVEKEDVLPATEVVAALEAHLGSVESALGLKHPEKIRYHKYRSDARKEELTGRPGGAHFDSNVLHATSYNDRHEIVHVLTEPWGHGSPFLSEGLAVHLAGSWYDRDVDDFTKMVIRTSGMTPLRQLADSKTFASLPIGVAYPQAGSFVRYLVRNYGMESLKKVYVASGQQESYADVSKRFEQVYPKSLEDLERDWWDYLLSLADEEP